MVLFPLLEQFAHKAPVDEMDLLLLDTPPSTPEEVDWEVIPSSSYSGLFCVVYSQVLFIT